MTKGAIVLTPFPFTDLTSTKRRPAVIVSQQNAGADVIVAFISSRVYLPVENTDYIIEPDTEDFAQTGLKVRSVVKLAKLVTLEKSILIGQLGTLSDRMVHEINERLRRAFGL